MQLLDFFKFSHRELTAFRTRSVATIITIGVLFSVLLGATFILQGLENVVMRYASERTNSLVYLASDYDDGRRPELILERILYYDGKVVEIPLEDITNLGFTPQYVAVFDNYLNAYSYFSRLDDGNFDYSPQYYRVSELYTNQMNVHGYFCHINKNIRPILIILLIAAVIILTFTVAHLITQNAFSISLYRSLGATRLQIFGIYFVYLLELCFYAMLFAIVTAFILAGIATVASWSYLQTTLAEVYPGTVAYPPVLIGFNWQCVFIIVTIFAAAPCAFLLCIDQFSTKKLAICLKGD